jgi:long-chain acyl-CoA synthetase
MNLALWLQRTAAVHPDRPAIGLGHEVWLRHGDFAHRVAQRARALVDWGVGAGDRVGLFLANRPEYLEWLWAAWWAGAAVVPVNAKLHAREAAWILGHAGCRVAVVEASQTAALSAAVGDEADGEAGGEAGGIHWCDPAHRVDDLAPLPLQPMGDDATAWLFYTSGTTGRPKGVMLGPRQLRGMSLAYLASVQPVSPGDVMLHPAPLSHGGGLYHLPYVLNGGLNVVPASGGFDAAECLDLAAHWRNASFFAAPTMVRRLVDVARQRGQRPEGLACITYGGGPMYLADLQDALALVGPRFAQIYGQGECPMTITVLPRAVIDEAHRRGDTARLASVGVAQGAVEVSVRGPDGAALPPGHKGEVCVRGELVMHGYWRDEAATNAAVRDGWLATGDIGQFDDAGFLTLLDRSKDLVVCGGSNVYPREVEEVLLQHRGVREVSVVGRPDREWGEVVVAYVVAEAGVDAAVLDRHCLDHVARFKRPKLYRFVDALPKNHYGKVLKTELRSRELAC